MKAFVCLAISCLLIGLLYVYVRQQFAFQSNQISQLTNLIKTMAVEISPKKEDLRELKMDPVDDRIEVSDDSCSETDSETDSDEEEEPVKRFELPKIEIEPVNELKVAKVEAKVEAPELGVELVELPELVVDDIEADDLSSKKITIETNYEAWSLKDLKAKISEMGGPTLKTKKLMLEYLEKKV